MKHKWNIPVRVTDDYREALARRNDSRKYSLAEPRLATKKEVIEHLSNHCDIEMSELERELEDL